MAMATETHDALLDEGVKTHLSGPSAALRSHEPSAAALEPADPVQSGDIVALVGEGEIPAMMVAELASHFGPVTVVQEQKQATSAMVKRRLRMLGPVQTIGQVGFGFLLKLLHKRAAARKAQITTENGLTTEPSAAVTRHDVASVNDDHCRDLIRAADPRVIVLVGTRMVRKATLDCVDAPFINYHAGLNPAYRGMNGGYWALAENDPAGAGVTVHLVDEGVDTGKELYWRRFTPSPADNFVTYPLLQAVVGRDLLIGAVHDALNGALKPQNVQLASAQWFHPTLWGYLWCGVTRGVW